MTKLANKLLILYSSVSIIAVCIRNHIPIMDLVTIVVMLIVAIFYGMLIGLQDE
jgi:hypothetical protein